MKAITIKIGVALMRLAGLDVTYIVSRRNGKQNRGYGRTLFATSKWRHAMRRAKELRCADTDTIFVRVEATIITRTEDK